MDKNRVLELTQYDVEIWDSKTQTYVADVSSIMTSDLSLTWKLNDLDEINFSLDLVQFRKKCEDMGVSAKDVISPYRHDVRIKRNGTYILGGQVVETNFTINRDAGDTMEVKVTGFLNLLKDQYVTVSYDRYSFPEIAKALINESQKPDNLFKNANVAKDVKYWIPNTGGQLFREIKGTEKPFLTISSRRRSDGVTPDWGGAAQRVDIEAGRRVIIELEYRTADSGMILYSRERRDNYSNHQTQNTLFQTSVNGNGQWNKFVSRPMTIMYDKPFITIEYQKRDSYLHLRNIRIYYADDTPEESDHGIRIGHDDTQGYPQTHERNYELQNVKQAIQNLTKLATDNFDFDFSYDRKFNLYSKKGSDNGIELSYPGNIDNMSINRSASELFNKVTEIGSGIGDARYQVTVFGKESRLLHGSREKVETQNDVKSTDTLLAHGRGLLYRSQNPTDYPEVTIADGSINPSNVAVGDIVTLKVVDDEYLETVNGKYRVEGMNISVSLENQETAKLTLVKIDDKLDHKKFIRYIRISTGGRTITSNNSFLHTTHIVEIQAFAKVNGVMENVARGKIWSEAGIKNHLHATDGDLSNDRYSEWAGNDKFTLDLGGLYPVEKIKIIPYHADNRNYHTVRVSAGETYKPRQGDLDYVLIDNQTLQATDFGWNISGIQEM